MESEIKDPIEKWKQINHIIQKQQKIEKGEKEKKKQNKVWKDK